MRRSCRKRIGGFTFLEIVIVIMILGIVTTLAVPGMNDFFTDERANAAADSAVTAIYYARSMAITTGVDHRVQFDAVSDTFYVQRYVPGGEMVDVFVTVENPLTKRDYAVSFQPVRLTLAQFGTGPSARFDATGSPRWTGEVRLEYGGRNRKVEVTPTRCVVTSE